MDQWLLLLSISITLSLFGILSNGGFIWIILRNQHLRSKTNYVLVSLAVSDLIVSAVVYPISLGNYRRLFTNYYSCVVAQSVIPCVPLVTVSHLLVLTGERFIAITHPLRYTTLVTPMRLKIVLSICWLIPLCLSTLPTIGWGVESFAINGSTHNLCNTFDVLSCPYLCMMATPNVLFCAIILIQYGFIFKEARNHFHFAQSFYQGTATETRQSRAAIQKELKSALIILTTIGFFTVTVLPVCIALYLDCYFVEIELGVWFVLMFMTFSNSLINPYIYGLGNKNIRRQVVISICPTKCHSNDGQRPANTNDHAVSISAYIPSDAQVTPSLS